jgi:plastocyanin
MNKNIIIIIVILLAVFAIYFLSGYYYKPASNTTLQTPAEGSNNVTIQNFSFSPQTITVAVGTTVTWTNNDLTTHSIISDSFNSQNFAPGTSYSYTFQIAGTYNYHCGIHPYMTGTIIVQ